VSWSLFGASAYGVSEFYAVEYPDDPDF
jgi:hypothetical protein